MTRTIRAAYPHQADPDGSRGWEVLLECGHRIVLRSEPGTKGPRRGNHAICQTCTERIGLVDAGGREELS